MYIDVEPQLLLRQAEKVKQYQQLYFKNFQRMNSNIEQLKIFWQGEEANQFINAWQLHASNDSIQHFNQALINYENQLKRAANLYLEAQNQAQLSAKRF